MENDENSGAIKEKKKRAKKEEVKEEKKFENNIISKEEYEYEKKQWKYKTIAWVAVFTAIAVVVTFAVSYYIGIGNKYNKLYTSTSEISNEDENGNGKTTAKGSIPDLTRILSTFAEVIDENYIGEINEKDLINSTIKGFVAGIGDEYSEYMTADDWKEFEESALGNYEGIGVYISQNADKNVVVVGTLPDSPAEKAGIKAEDVIVAINGESALGLTTSEVSEKVKGEEGTEVKVTISRNGEETEYTLKREAIKVYHVDGKMLDNETGYISLLTFDEGCSKEFEQKMDELVTQGAKNIILDLRYNTGGIVDEALNITDLFVDKGATTLIEKDNKGNETVYTSKTDKKYNVKMLILTNEYTASASEILTGALRDNGVAKSVGTKTYGKGVIQSVYSLSDGSALKLTVDEYFTPNRSTINKTGIEPDYNIEYDENDKETSDNGSQIDNQVKKALEVLKEN